MRPLPSQARIHEILDYDRETGIFRWRSRPFPFKPSLAGKIAGTKNVKNRIIFVDRLGYPAHRLAWVYCCGDCLNPGTIIDHKNCDPFDNRLDNLRVADHGENASNSRQREAKELPKGVSLQSGGNYRARIGIDKKVVYLGTFKTPEAAHDAYVAAAKAAKGEFARAV